MSRLCFSSSVDVCLLSCVCSRARMSCVYSWHYIHFIVCTFVWVHYLASTPNVRRFIRHIYAHALILGFRTDSHFWCCVLCFFDFVILRFLSSLILAWLDVCTSSPPRHWCVGARASACMFLIECSQLGHVYTTSVLCCSMILR